MPARSIFNRDGGAWEYGFSRRVGPGEKYIHKKGERSTYDTTKISHSRLMKIEKDDNKRTTEARLHWVKAVERELMKARGLVKRRYRRSDDYCWVDYKGRKAYSKRHARDKAKDEITARVNEAYQKSKKR